jgi:hypothetical protein
MGANMSELQLEEMKQLLFITDPGHGWLRVPYLETTGLDISNCSYTGQEWAYLEEDVDAAKYLRHLVKQGIEYTIVHSTHHDNQSSFIRRLDSYAEPEVVPCD